MWVDNMWVTSGVCRSALGVMLLSVGLGACGAESGEDLAEGPIASHQEELVVADKIFTDASGDVKIMVRTCDYPANATTGSRCHFCAVDQGWVMIGGGAEIEGSPSSGRLRASFPYPGDLNAPVQTFDGLETCTGNAPNNDLNKDFTAWMARSSSSVAHKLRAYVVGLQITGLSESTLAGYRNIADSTTSALAQPSIEQQLNSIVGGGATEVGSQSCYLTESRPDEANGSWRASAYCSPAGGLKVYAIAIDHCLPVPGWDSCMYLKTRSTVTGPTTGYGTASVVTPYPWVTTAIGGKGVVNAGSNSRFLTDLVPVVGSSQGVSATTKDHMVAINGTTTAYSINVMAGRWGTWWYNSVRFNTNGLTLHRPSGAAPVSLRQSTANPDAGPYRWSLEPFGSSGQYRLRNANPSQTAQGECAFRQSGTSNVQVGPCGTSNEYRWTFTSHPQQGPFKLRNVSSNTCLDNNSSVGNSNLRLATCISAYSDRQSLFLDTYSWLP